MRAPARRVEGIVTLKFLVRYEATVAGEDVCVDAASVFVSGSQVSLDLSSVTMIDRIAITDSAIERARQVEERTEFQRQLADIEAEDAERGRELDEEEERAKAREDTSDVIRELGMRMASNDDGVGHA